MSNKTGHRIFWLLHVVAVLFGGFLLVITVPLHLIYSKMNGKSEFEDNQDKILKQLQKDREEAEKVMYGRR